MTQQLKIVHVVPHINEEASGPSYSVPRLCTALGVRGHDVELSCLAAGQEIPAVCLDVHSQWPVLRRFAISASHAIALWRKASWVDIVHNHSLWSMVNVASGWVVPGRGAKFIVSPRGTLSTWALGRNRVLKQLLWPLQRRALDRADLLHATSETEYGEIRALGFSAPVAVIPNGVDLPNIIGEKTCAGGMRTLLFLSRIHPKKGVDRLLQAWKTLELRHPDWRLLIVGRGEQDYLQQVKSLATSLTLERVEFSGPRYGADKSCLYQAADLFVLPTHSENFGMVVAEALAHGCPTVVSQGAPWSGLEVEGCGWWVKHDVPSLTTALDSAMSMPAALLQEMGMKGRFWMERDFGWDSIAERMETTYRWLREGGNCPEWVRKS
ncbi:MAG: glycosyltransferase [Candidatus Competibacteraceae bacterium]|nr:glycosyltransferase [Candidatus Competibacteraceae bacterium]